MNNGTLSVIINGKEYSADVVNGAATVEIPGLNGGTYNVDLKYTGNQRVAIAPVAFTVFKQDAVISAGNKAYVINYGGKYSIILKDLNGTAVAGEKVTFTLNGKAVGSAVTNAKGVATISLTAKALKSAKAGKKNMVIKLTSDNYNEQGKNKNRCQKQEIQKIQKDQKIHNNPQKQQRQRS